MPNATSAACCWRAGRPLWRWNTCGAPGRRCRTTCRRPATYGLATALEEVGGANLEEADELYQVVIERWPGSKPAELSRQARTRIAERQMRDNAGGGLRPDAVMYMLDALRRFDAMSQPDVQRLALEIALKGQGGLDINDPDPKYTLRSLPGKF
jgi:hypothetical protein